jgi:molybdenum cofactor cytidylyltransferase
LFSARHFPALAALEGDEGARAVLAAAGSALRLLDIDEPGVLRDFDTVEAFADQS